MKRKQLKVLKIFRIAVQVVSCLYLIWWLLFNSEKAPSLLIVCIAPIATLILTRFEGKMSKTIDSADNSDNCSENCHN